MHERIDCAVIASGQPQWAQAISGSHLGGRLLIHKIPVKQAANPLLQQLKIALSIPILQTGRYDATLIYVDNGSLSTWRAVLASMNQQLPHNLIIYAANLCARALRDLMALGASDFIRPTFCPDELRARIYQTHTRAASVQLDEQQANYLDAHKIAKGMPEYPSATEQALCQNILNRTGYEIEAYAVAVASQRATSKESFKAAKKQVINRFERAYIQAALGCSNGNVTHAARMAQKHRRAFWTLIRKHDIDPTIYRNDG